MSSVLSIRETEHAIKYVKDTFEKTLRAGGSNGLLAKIYRAAVRSRRAPRALNDNRDDGVELVPVDRVRRARRRRAA